MSLCTSELTAILGTDCIGDSRLVINANFANLSADICTAGTLLTQISSSTALLSTTFINLSAKDSSTIDLFYSNTGTTTILSADVINGSISMSKLGGDIPLTTKQFLTAAKISNISDVLLGVSKTLQTGDVLRWNAATQQWRNEVVNATLASLADGVYGDVIVSSGNFTILPNTVTNVKIIDGAVSTNKIANESVTTSKLVSAAGSEAVITDTIRDNAITSAKIAAGAVTDTKIGANAITTTKILDQAVTNAKFTNPVALSIKGNPNGFVDTLTDIVATNPNGVLRRFNNTLGFGSIDNSVTSATSASTPNTIVSRDTFGDFSCRTIISDGTATYGLLGTALSAALAIRSVQLQTARTIELTGAVEGSAAFDGTQNILITTTGGGEINTGANVGTGTGIFKDKTNSTLNYKTLSAGANISITSDTNHVLITNTLTAVPSQAQAKAWIYFNAQSGTIVNSYNVTSIQRLGYGVWYINLTPGLFASANYCVVANTMQGNTGEGQYTFGGVTGNNAGLYADIACARPDLPERVLYESFKSYDVRSDNVFNFVAIFG